MENWRRQGENHNQMSSSSKKNLSKGINQQQTVPLWEKKFCWEVGAVPWRKLLETKQLIHTYDSILGWKDSAAKEAFDNAKARYWAGLKGLKCDIPNPDPNIHIDNVDWSCESNLELILDLDRDDGVSNNTSRESVLIFPEGFGKGQEVVTNDDGGWANAEDGFKIPTDAEYLEKIQGDCLRSYADPVANEENKVQENCDHKLDNGWKDEGYSYRYRVRSDGDMLRYKTSFNGNGKFNDGGHNSNHRKNQWVRKNWNNKRGDTLIQDQGQFRQLKHHGSAK